MIVPGSPNPWVTHTVTHPGVRMDDTYALHLQLVLYNSKLRLN